MTTAGEGRLSAFKWDAKAETLEAKTKLLSLLPYHPDCRRKHSLVMGFVLDWYHSRYGNALASVRHITAHVRERDPFGAGLYAGDVHSALTDLVAWEFLGQEKGAGRRASRYVPNWNLLRSVRETPNAKGGGSSVLDSPNATVLVSPNASGRSVLESPNEDPSTPTRSLDPGTERDIDSAGAAPPPAAAALGAAPAVPSEEDGFERLYRVYGFRRGKEAARAAFLSVVKDTAMLAVVLASAAAWREAWESQGKKDAPRKELATWLLKGHWDEDPPRGYIKPAKARPTPKASRVAANDNLPPVAKVAPVRAISRQRVTVEKAEDVTTASGQLIRMHLKTEAGEIITHDLMWEHRDAKVQEAGQQAIVRLAAVTGKDSVDDAACLRGCSFVYTGRMGADAYDAA